MIFLGRFRTRDGAPRGPRPRIETHDDLLRYRDQQLELMEQGTITRALYRLRIRRWCERYREMRSNQIFLRDRAQASQPNEKGDHIV